MNALLDLAGERRIDHTVGGDAALAGERLSRDLNAEMTFALRPVTGMPLVKMGLVHHFEGIRVKNLG